MIGQFDFAQKGWVKRKGTYCRLEEHYRFDCKTHVNHSISCRKRLSKNRSYSAHTKVAYHEASITSTNARATNCSAFFGFACGDPAHSLTVPKPTCKTLAAHAALTALLFDFAPGYALSNSCRLVLDLGHSPASNAARLAESCPRPSCQLGQSCYSPDVPPPPFCPRVAEGQESATPNSPRGNGSTGGP